MKHFPFSFFALAPFSGARNAMRILPPLDIYDIDEGIAALDCRVAVPLPKTICPKGEIEVAIRKLADLKPVHLVRCSDYLTSLVDALDFVKTNRTDPEAIAMGLQQRFGHLPLDLTVLADEEKPREENVSLVDSILSKVDLPDTIAAPKPRQLHAQLEEMLKTALFNVYRNSDFRRLESTLRGVQMLVRQGPIKKSKKMSLTLCNAAFESLEETMRLIVRNSSEHMPSLVLVDMPFDNSFASVDTMETIANFSEAVSAPTVIHVSPRFFDQREWEGLTNLGYLSHEIDTQPYAKFRALRSIPSARWVTLAVGEVCARNPYGTQEKVRPVEFKEARETWVSPVWVVGTLAAKSQYRFGWATRLTDHGVCRVEDMVIPTQAGKLTPVAAQFKQDRLKQFYEIGMTPLQGMVGREDIFLPQAVTLFGGTLGYQLFTNRIIGFFHHQKSLLEENGEAVDPEAIKEILRTRFLKKWQETEQPLPTNLDIDDIGQRDAMGQAVFSVRVDPPRSLVPELLSLEFEITF
jgi:hypothetical protein